MVRHKLKFPLFFGPCALLCLMLMASAAANGQISAGSVASINNLKNAAYCADTSVSANTITCSTAVGFTSYAAGQAVDVLLANTVTGATTININGLGAKAVTYNGTNALTSAIGWNAGATGRLLYDGTRLVMQGLVSTGGACPGGSPGQVQFNVSAGVCGGDSNLTWDNTTKILAVGPAVLAGSHQVVNIPWGEAYLNDISIARTFTDFSVPGIAGSRVSGQQINIVLDPSSNITNGDLYPPMALGSAIRLTGSQDVGYYSSADIEAVMEGTGTVGRLVGTLNSVYVNSNGTATLMQGNSCYAALYTAGGTVEEGACFWAGWENDGGTWNTAYAYYSADMAGIATNSYYEWFDSRGVRRVREANTFDGVGQAIEALYNPQFTKYTPGAVDFERVILGQWNGNVAEIGNEAGGTGTLRRLRFIGVSDEIPTIAFAALSTPGNATENYCSDCTVTSAIDDTCAGSGSGAFAFRIAGAWKCNI